MPADALPEKGLPQNIEAERCVLGAILLDNQLVNQAVEFLSPEDFYLSSHRVLFQQMESLLESSKAIDLVTLANAVDGVGQLEAIGGRSFISSLIDEVPRLTNLEHYARIVQEKSTLRSLIKRSNQIISSCYEQQDEVENVLDNAEKAIFEIAESKIRTGFVSLGQLAKTSFKKIEAAAGQRQMVTGIASGFTRFDELTSGVSGLRPGGVGSQARHGQDVSGPQHCQPRRPEIREERRDIQSGDGGRSTAVANSLLGSPG